MFEGKVKSKTLRKKLKSNVRENFYEVKRQIANTEKYLQHK